MHPIPSECPVCHSELTVTKLYCRECDTSIEGRFVSGPFSQLNAEQVEFVEIFIKNEGKLTHMEDELKMSYPTIRNRLHEVIRALGYEPGKEDSSGLSDEDRREILDELNQGKISSDEAMKKLKEGED